MIRWADDGAPVVRFAEFSASIGNYWWCDCTRDVESPRKVTRIYEYGWMLQCGRCRAESFIFELWEGVKQDAETLGNEACAIPQDTPDAAGSSPAAAGHQGQ